MSAIQSMALTIATLAAIFVPLERAFPARRSQPIFRREWTTDALFLAGQYVVWNTCAFAALGAASTCVSTVNAGLAVAFARLPFLARAAIVVVLGDLAVYWFHRACHTFEPLWRFHAVHHSAERLDWVAAHREHPLDGLCTALAANLPAFLLGFDVKTIAALSALRGLWSLFIHSNVRLPLGPLRWILGAPDLHHWHHARVERTLHNFGNTAPYLDVLFGTHHRPPGEGSYPLGISGAWPRGYCAQLVHPFVVTWRHFRRARSNASRAARTSGAFGSTGSK